MTRQPSTLILAMDTSTRNVGVALYDGNQVICEHNWLSSDFHTVELAPMVQRSFTQSGLKVADLAAIVVTTGPGSFTGLRIGIALAKGIALAQHIPLVGIPTLDITAYAQIHTRDRLGVVLRAGRGRLALGWYLWAKDHWQSQPPLEVHRAEQLVQVIEKPCCIAGELSREERLVLATNPMITLASPLDSMRRAAILAEIGYKRWQAGQTDDPAFLSPIYLHYNDPIPG